MNFAEIILQQLGGRQFIAMTGSKNFVYENASDKNPDPWFRMDLSQNKAGVNRLKVTLKASDTYTLEFYKMTMNRKTFECKISKQQIFEGVYEDQLQSIFTEVTGLYTRL